MACIYLSDWNPRGIRKEWERCSVASADAQRIFGEYVEGDVKDACGWFEGNGALRVLVADTTTGHRLTGRQTKRYWVVDIGYPDEARP